MVAGLARRDVSIGFGCMAFIVVWDGVWGFGQALTSAFWAVVGILLYGSAFTTAGRLKPRKPVEDNVRVVRHMIFVMAVLCTGTVIVGMIEALAAYLVRPWWLQVAVNLLITIGAFVGGTRVFDFSHEWLIGDSSLDYPLWALDICVIS